MTNFELKEGTICLIEKDIERAGDAEQGADDFLISGAPVKIVKIETVDDDTTVTVVDGNGTQWETKHKRGEARSQYVALDNEKIEFLLSKAGSRRYRMHHLSDDGNSIKYDAPVNILSGILMCLVGVRTDIDVLALLSIVTGGMLITYGFLKLIAGLVYKKKAPLSFVERMFFFFGSERKEELKKLLEQK